MRSDSGSRSSDAGRARARPSTAASSSLGRAVAQASVDAADAAELLAAARRTLHEPDEREVGEHVARRHVEASAVRSRQAADLLRDAARLPAQLARALDPPPRDLGLGACADALPALLALVGGPLEPAHRLESRDELVVQREQVLDVGRRVDALFGASAAGASSR